MKLYIKYLLLALFILSSNSFAQYTDGARYAFSASVSESKIFVTDLVSKETVDQFSLTTEPDYVAASLDLKALIVAHRNAKALTLVDLSKKGFQQIPYPLTISPDIVIISPLGETAAIYDEEAKRLEVHALKRKAILLELDNVTTNKDFTFNLDGSKLYWVDYASGELRNADLWSKQQSLRLTRNGDALSALTRSIDGQLGFISDSQRNVVTVIDLAAMKILREIPVGSAPQRPWGTSDGQYMLIPNNADNSVTAISTFSLEVLYTVPGVANATSINPGWLDSNTALIGKNGEVEFIETISGKSLASYDLNSTVSEGLVTSDSKTLAVSTAGGITFFDMRNSEILASISDLPNDLSKASAAVSNNLCH